MSMMVKASNAERIPGSSELHFDIVLLADMTRSGDCGLRIKQEIQTYHEMGFDTALIHLPAEKAGVRVSNDIQRCVRENRATVIAPGTKVSAKLAIVYSPGTLEGDFDFLADLRAAKVVLVQDRKPDLQQMGAWFRFAIGPMSWAPTNRWIRSSLAKMGMPVPLEKLDWRPVARPVASPKCGARRDRRLVVGRVSVPGAAQWPADPEKLAEIYPVDATIDFRVLGGPPSALAEKVALTDQWTIMNPTRVSVERFIEMLDVFVYYPNSEVPELPEAAIATAMASGKIVVLPPGLQPHFGDGAIYAEPEDAFATFKRLFEDQEALQAAREAAVYHSGFQFSRKVHEEKIKSLVGISPRRRRARSSKVANRKRALFVPSNGIGLGHVTRLLAIARRMPPEIEPIFVSLSQAARIIESFGYPSEYLPSQKEINANFSRWDDWFRYELGRKIDQFDVDVVIYDGNNPTPGLVDATLAHGRSRLVWVRRGMGGAVPSPFLENSRFFDLIIEPGEIAGELDTGPTAARRGEVVMVDPIRLLDRAELYPRKEAMAKLGLDPEAPAMLLHLGGGANRDILGLLETIVDQLKIFPTLQIVMAEWGNGLFNLPRWSNTHVLRGFPICKYFNAFNFSIAAAGYNSYHEVIGFGLPTIFLPNRDPSMDDQEGRADFAQDHGAGFVLPEDQMFHLRALCETLMNDAAREVVQRNCMALARGNGARDAANSIMEVCGVG